MKMTKRLEHAVRVAAKAHRNQTRKGSDVPYIIHPFNVMLIAQTATDNEDTLIACLFHDILEDVSEEYPETTMQSEFGEEVVSIVKLVTKNDEINDWHERNQAYLDVLSDSKNKQAMIVACADKIHNLLSTLSDYDEQGDAIWEIFTSDKQAQVWWYESVYSTIKDNYPDLLLLEQLEKLIDDLKLAVGGDE